jgi:protein TonB
MEQRPPAGGLNLLDLRRPPQRRQGFYRASVIVSIVVHGGFLAYLLTYARLPGQQTPRPRLAGVNIEMIGTTPFAALPRGDREDVTQKARLPDATPQARLGEEAVEPDAADISARALANQIIAPLPEDGARMDKPLPLPERFPQRRSETSPAVPGRAPAIATPRSRAGPGMSVPARRLARIAPQARLHEPPVADPQSGDVETAPDAIPLPPLKLLAASNKADPAPGSDEGRAPALDMGAQGSPVVAVLPKEAGVAMFAARIVEDAQMLPEDRPAAPVQLSPEPSADGRPVPPSAKRVAKAERGGPESSEDKSASSSAIARKALAYRANVRAHLASNRPAGAYGSGRAVVAFGLSPAGGLRSVRIARSSGSPSLDQSVLQSVYRAAPFPKPPAGLKPEQLRFLIPFEFR